MINQTCTNHPITEIHPLILTQDGWYCEKCNNNNIIVNREK